MKISFVFPRFKTFSGAEHLMIELSRFAVEAGHEVCIATRSVDPVCRELLDERVEVVSPARLFRVLTGIHLVDSFFDSALAPMLASHLPSEIDVVCCLGPPTLPALWALKRRSGKPFPAVYYCLQPPRFAYDLMRETMAANGLLGRFVPLVAIPYRWLDRRLAPLADRIFVISGRYRDWCRQLYGDVGIELVFPGVDLAPAAQADPSRVRARFSLPPGAPLIVTANKLIVRKNLDVFLEAMKIVVGEHPDARALIVGDGPLLPRLVRLRDRLGLSEQVVFTGFLPRFEEVLDCIAAADVYVFLEKNVPFGLTVIEAGACARPVVAVRGGGTDDTVVDGLTGLLVDGESLRAEDVAECLVALLGDRDASTRMGAAGRESASRFSFESTATYFLERLEAAAGRHA